MTNPASAPTPIANPTSTGENTSAIASVDPRGNRNTLARIPVSTVRAAAPAPPTSHGIGNTRATAHSAAYGAIHQRMKGMAIGENPEPSAPDAAISTNATTQIPLATLVAVTRVILTMVRFDEINPTF